MPLLKCAIRNIPGQNCMYVRYGIVFIVMFLW